VTQDNQPLIVAYQQPSHDTLTKYDLSILAIRLVGLYFFVQSLFYIMELPAVFLANGKQNMLQFLSFCAPCLVQLVMGVLLLRLSRGVARWIFPEFSASHSLTLTGQDLQAVLFSVVGVWLIATAMPDTGRLATEYWWLGKTRQPQQMLSWIPRAVGLLIQIAAGAFLFARANGLSAAWHRLRYAGLQLPASNQTK
jgi:hypothetical protein